MGAKETLFVLGGTVELGGGARKVKVDGLTNILNEMWIWDGIVEIGFREFLATSKEAAADNETASLQYLDK